METRVKIDYIANDDITSFGSFKMSFTDHTKYKVHSVEAKFDFRDFWEFSQDTSSIAFDFLILSLLVYDVDRVLRRELFSEDGWCREITLVDVPAVNLSTMNIGKKYFDNAISFLTGDSWNISFCQAPAYDYHPTPRMNYDRSVYKKVSLFSGGLDSLIGFVDEASTLEANKKILLISHKELGKEGKDQDRILDICRTPENNFFENRFTQLRMNAGLNSSTWVNRLPAEGTFRSRSLLFFAMGIYAAHHIDNNTPVIVPENGTISINIPLDKGRRSACSTRTTHPTFIKKLQIAILAIGINNKFVNPYKFKSKADMMIDSFTNPDKKRILTILYQASCSCAKRSHNSYWNQRGHGINHCGICLPCLYRRVSLDAVGLDDSSKLGIDLFTWDYVHLTDPTYRNYVRYKDFKSVLRFLIFRHNADSIREELMLNGVTNPRELENYVNLAMHSYNQVKAWIAKNASNDVKLLTKIQ